MLLAIREFFLLSVFFNHRLQFFSLGRGRGRWDELFQRPGTGPARGCIYFKSQRAGPGLAENTRVYRGPSRDRGPGRVPSTITSISKPCKDPTFPSSYRPISLTSVLCKVMMGVVNVRLLDFFDQKVTLSTLQCGDRAKRTTIDHLPSLEATVRKAQTNREQVLSIFFEM